MELEPKEDMDHVNSSSVVVSRITDGSSIKMRDRKKKKISFAISMLC